MDRLQAMETFARVAEHGSFSAAARLLDQPRGTVSKHVAALEQHFGVRLLQRTTRRVTLTEAGESLLSHCRGILGAMRAAQDDLQQQRQRPRGRLKVSAPVAFTQLHLLPVLHRFVQAHPQVALDLDCDDRFVDLVKDGFDVAVRIGALPPSTLVARRLAASPVLLCASPGYLGTHGTPRRPQDLHQHACLGYAYQAGGQRWDLGAGRGGPRTLRVRTHHRINDNHVLRALVLAGEGIAQLPAYLVERDLREGSLVPVLPRHRDDSRGVYAVYPSRAHLPAKARAFVDCLALAFAGGASWEEPG